MVIYPIRSLDFIQRETYQPGTLTQVPDSQEQSYPLGSAQTHWRVFILSC
jgi:hypothetical protein